MDFVLVYFIEKEAIIRASGIHSNEVESKWKIYILVNENLRSPKLECF